MSRRSRASSTCAAASLHSRACVHGRIGRIGAGTERGRLCGLDLVGDAVGLDCAVGLVPRVALDQPVFAGPIAEDAREMLTRPIDRVVGFALDRLPQRALG